MFRAILLATSFATSFAHSEPLTIVAFGDMPYGNDRVAPYRQLIEKINAAKLDLVIHVGDTKSGRSSCKASRLKDRLEDLNSFDVPALYTPGDNEWTDCKKNEKKKKKRYGPKGALHFIREHYFASPDWSFGASALKLRHQGAKGQPENVRLVLGGVMVATVHVVGSNNNFSDDPREWKRRNSLNKDWLGKSFEAAQAAKVKAAVIALHADMFDKPKDKYKNALFDRDEETWPSGSGFQSFGERLIAEAVGFGKPVLVVTGDSHTACVRDWLPTRAPNLRFLVVPGDKGKGPLDAAKIQIDLDDDKVFQFGKLLGGESLKKCWQ